ncbi:hypothetical protein ACOMHN_010030 [Nucella lapillus]
MAAVCPDWPHTGRVYLSDSDEDVFPSGSPRSFHSTRPDERKGSRHGPCDSHQTCDENFESCAVQWDRQHVRTFSECGSSIEDLRRRSDSSCGWSGKCGGQSWPAVSAGGPQCRQACADTAGERQRTLVAGLLGQIYERGPGRERADSLDSRTLPEGSTAAPPRRHSLSHPPGGHLPPAPGMYSRRLLQSYTLNSHQGTSH